MKSKLARCHWPTAGDPLYLKYHDTEWGVPVYNDKKIFEFLVLEVFQAGLSWRTVLYKRENFRKAFAGFDFNTVAKFTQCDIARLVKDVGIIRNRAKIEATINNAQKFIIVRKEFGTFAKYMWQWIDNKPLIHKFKTLKDYSPFIAEAVVWSKDLKKRGFKFLGPTVIYAHMQAVGMVNDHTVDCFRYKAVKTQAQ